MIEFTEGQRVHVMSNGHSIRGRVICQDSSHEDTYWVRTPSGQELGVNGVWLKPRKVRNQSNF